jgi:beta-lactamase superfamily II metal-dependent hydrolase
MPLGRLPIGRRQLGENSSQSVPRRSVEGAYASSSSHDDGVARSLLASLARPLAALPTLGIAIVLALASVLVWLLILGSPGDRLSVTFLDVGQGDAILIRSPAGHNILVDGGPDR